MRLAFALLCVVAASCHRDDGGIDTPVDGGVPFGTPVMIKDDGFGGDHDPSMTTDMRVLYTSRAGDVWRYDRNIVTIPFGTGTTGGGNTVSTHGSYEEGPDVSADGTVMFFARNESAPSDIYTSTRMGGEWTDSTRIPELDLGGNSANPSVSRDGSMIVFERLDETQYSLWESTITSGQWMSPQPITSLPISGDVKPHSPMLSADKLTIYFHALGTSGTNDIFEAHRPTLTAAFGAATPVPGINTDSEQEEDPWISEDGKTIVFVRTQDGVTQVMMAQRPS